MNVDRRAPFALLFLLFLLSGATSLVYEVIWLRKLILIFGSTQFATSTILSTFMGGLALGAFVAGRWLGRSTMRPLRLYGLLEVGIGLYALAVPVLFSSLTPVYRAAWQAGASGNFLVLSLAKFAGIALVLLPPTVLMGASLPVLARQVADDPRRIGGKVGSLYAVNTFGAVIGVFLSGFVSIPNIGVTRTVWVTASINGLLGIAAILLAGRFPSVAAIVAAAPADARPPSTPARVRLALVVFGLSGFGALVLEVAWTRVLALVIGSSVYAFSLMLLAFLVGLALGSAWFSRFLRRRPGTDPGALLAALLAAAGFLAYATAFVFQALPRIYAEIFFAFDPGPNAWFLIQLALGLVVMFPATFALGGIFPTVVQIHARSLERVAASVGTVYASNTLGTIVGAAAAGFLLIPHLGVLPTVILVAILEILLGLAVALFAIPRAARGKRAAAMAMTAAAVLIALVRPGWDVNMMNSGVYMNLFDLGEQNDWETFRGLFTGSNNVVLYAAEGYTASVYVADQPEYDNRYLSVNGKIEASTSADLDTQLMCAHLPLLLHRNPGDVMVIGLASGITVGAAATHPVASIRVVEVEKAMVPAARLFAAHNNEVLDDPRVKLSINDARNELEFSPDTYDVIISEPSNPWMTVASNLFTEEFFLMARTRLRPGGVFSQWIQNYYLPAEDLRSIVAAFRTAFRYVMMFETSGGVDVLLMGSQEPLGLDLDLFQERMAELRVRMDLGRVYVRHPLDIVTRFRLGAAEVDRFVEGAPRNTDDNARVEFSAPKTLGAYTLAENRALIHSHLADPLDYIEPPVAEPAKRDEIRLMLAERWMAVEEYDLAKATGGRALGGPLGAEAAEILKKLAETGTKP